MLCYSTRCSIARIQWSSPHYDYMLVDGVRYDNTAEEAAKRVAAMAALIIVVGGILNYFVNKRKNREV